MGHYASEMCCQKCGGIGNGRFRCTCTPVQKIVKSCREYREKQRKFEKSWLDNLLNRMLSKEKDK